MADYGFLSGVAMRANLTLLPEPDLAQFFGVRLAPASFGIAYLYSCVYRATAAFLHCSAMPPTFCRSTLARGLD
jgi:hypothetical protein